MHDYRWRIIFLFLVALAITVPMAGCGAPHRKSAAEIKKEQAQARQARYEARRKADAEARVKRAQERAKIAAMPRTPPGIEQMDSVHFYVHHGFEGNTRDLCRTSADNEPAGISSIDPAPNGTEDIIVVCNNAEHEYRHAPLATKASP